MRLTEKSKARQTDKLADKLSSAGLRVTEAAARIWRIYCLPKAIAMSRPKRWLEEAVAAGLKISQATVYNTLNQFHAAGLLRQVQVDQARSYFDTNIDAHHHFYVEEEARLIDIAARRGRCGAPARQPGRL